MTTLYTCWEKREAVVKVSATTTKEMSRTTSRLLLPLIRSLSTKEKRLGTFSKAALFPFLKKF